MEMGTLSSGVETREAVSTGNVQQRNLMLIVEYDGTRFAGFQVQPNAPSIQGEIELAILRATGEKTRITGAGRTDAGVHAAGQVVNFRTGSNLPAATVARAMNFYLPEDIAVRDAREVEFGFCARRRAKRREYEYTIFNGPTRSPLWRGHSYHISFSLDVGLMNEACCSLIGQHDFAAFAGANAARLGTTVRRIEQAGVARQGNLVRVRMVGDAFLPHQVRNTVGTLLWVGSGKLDLSGFRRILEGRDRGKAGPAVPPQGLCLVKVDY